MNLAVKEMKAPRLWWVCVDSLPGLGKGNPYRDGRVMEQAERCRIVKWNHIQQHSNRIEEDEKKRLLVGGLPCLHWPLSKVESISVVERVFALFPSPTRISGSLHDLGIQMFRVRWNSSQNSGSFWITKRCPFRSTSKPAFREQDAKYLYFTTTACEGLPRFSSIAWVSWLSTCWSCCTRRVWGITARSSLGFDCRLINLQR